MAKGGKQMHLDKNKFKPFVLGLGAILLGVFLLSGCATQGSVNQKLAELDGKVGKMSSEVAKIGPLEQKVANHDQRIAALEGKVDGLTKTVGQLQTDVKALQSAQAKESSLVKTSVVHFGLNKWKLTPETTKSLADVVAQIKKTRNYQVVIEGHTDRKGSQAYNYKLGEKRAEAVLRYLVANGVNVSQTSLISWGKDQAKGKDKKGRAADRRVEIKLYGIGEK